MDWIAEKVILDSDYLIVSLPNTEKNVLEELVKSGKKLTCEIKPYRKKRSLDANSFMWLLCQRIAEKIGSTKDDVYLTMLERYGIFTHVIIKPAAVEHFMKTWNTAKILGDVTINGQSGVQIQCYYGSSTYDSEQMRVLVDGIVSECKELGIETKSAEEIESMLGVWGNSLIPTGKPMGGSL